MEYTFYKLSIADKCYVGSTIDFDNRMNKHKCSCNNENDKKYHLKVYQYIRENGCWNDVNIMIIDKIIYNDKDEAREMETKFMLSFNAELNSVYPKRSMKEYYEANKQKILEKNKEYAEKNREKVSEGKKEWRKTHKELMNEYKKKYKENNKQKISEKQKVKIPCDICSKMISRSNISIHKKIKHPITDENIHPF
jgi:hypothetical protein